MDFNRVEAIKAKEMAEKMLMEKDFHGARRLVFKSIGLSPELEGIRQLQMALEVYIASKRKINGEIDWYGVLGVNPFQEKEIIRKQYYSLAFLLHPDRNKIVGTEDAFKIVSQAWRLISDEEMRSAYDQRRGSIKVQAYPPNAECFHAYKKMDTTNVEMAKSTTGAGPSSGSLPKHQAESFWTICGTCKFHYEYLTQYLDKLLVCLNCSKPFHAYKAPLPGNSSMSPVSSAHKRNMTPPSGVSIRRGSAKKLKRDTKLDIRKLMVEKALTEVRKKLSELSGI